MSIHWRAVRRATSHSGLSQQQRRLGASSSRERASSLLAALRMLWMLRMLRILRSDDELRACRRLLMLISPTRREKSSTDPLRAVSSTSLRSSSDTALRDVMPDTSSSERRLRVLACGRSATGDELAGSPQSDIVVATLHTSVDAI